MAQLTDKEKELLNDLGITGVAEKLDFAAKFDSVMSNMLALLQKLDQDTGVTDTDYESTLAP